MSLHKVITILRVQLVGHTSFGFSDSSSTSPSTSSGTVGRLAQEPWEDWLRDRGAVGSWSKVDMLCQILILFCCITGIDSVHTYRDELQSYSNNSMALHGCSALPY